MTADFFNLSLTQIIEDAENYFGFDLNLKKIKISNINGAISFLGYTVEGPLFIRATRDLLKSVLYTEHGVTDLD